MSIYTGLIFFLVVVQVLIVSTASAEGETDAGTSFYLIGVSGGLQDGFPNRINLDYRDPITGETISKAILLGKAFVRGYKSYLDVMEDGWRQYQDPSSDDDNDFGGLTVNPNVFASGCYEHANEHFVYLVDSRQVFSILMNEPRFLSITPDTGLIELKHSSSLIQGLARHEILNLHSIPSYDKENGEEERPDIDLVAFPLVTAVWFQSTSLVESPPIKTVDGAQVTNYPESLALWAGADDADRLAYIKAHEDCLVMESNKGGFAGDNGKGCAMQAHESYQRYWSAIKTAIRKEELDRKKRAPSKVFHGWNCKEHVRFGTSREMTRINYIFSAGKIQSILKSIGYEIDFVAGNVSRKLPIEHEL